MQGEIDTDTGGKMPKQGRGPFIFGEENVHGGLGEKADLVECPDVQERHRKAAKTCP